jgi:GNAT superfamily N-acetyltransferase
MAATAPHDVEAAVAEAELIAHRAFQLASLKGKKFAQLGGELHSIAEEYHQGSDPLPWPPLGTSRALPVCGCAHKLSEGVATATARGCSLREGEVGAIAGESQNGDLSHNASIERDDFADLSIRSGGPRDVGALVALFDEAIDWLVARGQTGQWGDQHASSRPGAISRFERLAAGGGLRIAERAARAEGALVVGPAPEYVPAVDRRELYVLMLLTSRQQAGRRIGTRLIERAIDEARERGCEQLRIDCWAGAPSLIAWYQRNGFEPSDTFELKGWRGQIFTMPLLYTTAR